MWGGMYTNPDQRRRIAKFSEIHARFAGRMPPPEADILVVFDPDSAYGVLDPFFGMVSGDAPTASRRRWAAASSCATS